MLLCFDVLIQYLGTLAIGEGFYPDNYFQRNIIHLLFSGNKKRGMASDPSFHYRRVEMPSAI